jgi:hypothetical protein
MAHDQRLKQPDASDPRQYWCRCFLLCVGSANITVLRVWMAERVAVQPFLRGDCGQVRFNED